MSAQHTPGPWIVSTDAHGRTEVHSETPSRAMQTWRAEDPLRPRNSFKGVLIATFGAKYNGSGPQWGPPVTLSQDEADANANLVGAAPDLLEALEELAEPALGPKGACHVGICSEAMCGRCKRHARARAAIEKAKGVQP